MSAFGGLSASLSYHPKAEWDNSVHTFVALLKLALVLGSLQGVEGFGWNSIAVGAKTKFFTKTRQPPKHFPHLNRIVWGSGA